MRPSYSDAELTTIGGLLADGLTASAIAAALGRQRRTEVTRNQIIGIVSRNESLAAIGFQYYPGGGKVRTRKTGGTSSPKAMPKAALPPVLPPAPPPPVPTHEPRPRMVPLVALEAFDCRWPVGDPLRADFGHCGHRKADGSSYCPYHHARAYRPAEQPRKAA